MNSLSNKSKEMAHFLTLLITWFTLNASLTEFAEFIFSFMLIYLIFLSLNSAQVINSRTLVLRSCTEMKEV